MFKPHVLCLAIATILLVSCKKDDSSIQSPESTGTERPVKRDVQPPVVAIINPANGTAVWDTYLSVQASDNIGIRKIEMFEDGKVIQSWQAETNNKSVTSWSNTYIYNPGLMDVRELTAVVTDWAGNSSQHQITVYKLISCCTPPPAGN